MNLRQPHYLDLQFFKECYADWPVSEVNPPILDEDIKRWITRWMHRSDEVCLIGGADVPVGFIVYRRERPQEVQVVNLVVHPTHRGEGHSNAIVRALRDRLVADGVKMAQFDALQGPIADQIERGKYVKVGTVQGKTGPLVRGRLTVDMEI